MTDALTPEQIEELRGLAAKATPGPWDADFNDGEYGWQPRISATDGRLLCVVGNAETELQDQWEADAALIVVTINALPALLDLATASLAGASAGDNGCVVCNGDCAAANPTVLDCPAYVPKGGDAHASGARHADGTVPHWPHFVLGARDPASPTALRAYADACGGMPGFDADYIASIRELADDFDAYRAAEGLGDPYAAPHRHDDPATLAIMRGEDGPITVRHERFNTPKALLEAADPVAVGQAFDRDTLLNVIELLKGRRSLRWDWKSKAIRKGEVTSGMMHGAAADECDGIISTIEGKLREMRDASIQPPVPK